MSRILSVEVPDQVYESLSRAASATGRTTEALALQWLSYAVDQLDHDPLDECIGSLVTEVTDWGDRHDEYLGQSLARELGETGDDN